MRVKKRGRSFGANAGVILVRAWVECENSPEGTEEMGLIRIEPHENVPLWVDEEHGVIRIPGTRLTLETVIHMYYEGFTEPEEIVRSFDTLTVEAARQILHWYQTRREEVDAYMEWSEKTADLLWAEVEPRMAEFRRLKKESRLRQAQSV